MGFASLIISLWLLSGIIISLIGVVGIYLGKLFEKAKGRPTFIVNEKYNIDTFPSAFPLTDEFDK